MEVKVCKGCRRLFNYIYGPELCPDCIRLATEKAANPDNGLLSATLIPNCDLNDTKFEQVKDYIMSNPKATVAQIAEAADIKPAKIFEWIREDRLEFSDDSSYAWFQCEKCGAKIRSGRLCNRCKTTK
jgi:hypothetical protein